MWNENDEYFSISLNPEIAEKEWIDFLNAFYDLRFDDKKKEGVTEYIKGWSSYHDWIDIAQQNRFESYQYDTYLYYPIEGGDGFYSLYANVKQIILSMDGKIMMECYNDLFSFFTKLIHEKMRQYKLSDSLLVYITG